MLMLPFLTLLASVSSVRSEYSVRCAERNGTSVTVRPAKDGEPGRYEVDYCAAVGHAVLWELGLKTADAQPEHCGAGVRGLKVHSYSEETIKLNLNCTYVCFTKHLDLLFRHCYHMFNRLIAPRGQYHDPYNTYFFADNNVTLQHYSNTTQLVKDFSDGQDVVAFHWFTGNIPVTSFVVTACRVNKSESECRESVDVSSSCGRSGAHELRCLLQLPRGCYLLELSHTAPWTSGLQVPHQKFVNSLLCNEEVSREVPARAPSALWWACGAAAAAALGALAALLRCDARLAAKGRRRVLRAWRGVHDPEAASARPAPPAAQPPAEPPPLRVLLLYARDCAAAERAVHALHHLLEQAAPGHVYDIFSAEVTALAGPAPAAWVRAALCDPRLRVVLLQTPALQCLQRARLAARGEPALSSPLLPRAVLYRAPEYGDTLLQYALRLLADPAAAPAPRAPYHKYYLATLSSVPAEAFPSVVPYRRYELPGAAAVLLRDLVAPSAAPEPLAEPLAELELAGRALAEQVSGEDYLAEVLMPL